MILKNTDYDKMMRIVPGPMPWYMDPLVENCSFDNFEWIKTEGSEKLRPKVLLRKTKTKSVVLILNFYCYVQKISQNQLLIWFMELDEFNDPSCLRLIVVDVNHLKEIINTEQILEKMDNLKSYIQYDVAFKEEIKIPADITEVRDFEFPDVMKQVEELLIIGRNNSREKEGVEKGDFAIYKIDPRQNSIKAIYQDWFNYHGYDLGYVWITRVGRDFNTNNIIGEGFRIPKFILNETGDQFIEWIRDTPGYF